jgi:hypothetical protein
MLGASVTLRAAQAEKHYLGAGMSVHGVKACVALAP